MLKKEDVNLLINSVCVVVWGSGDPLACRRMWGISASVEAP
jgi:hypothetical protein